MSSYSYLSVTESSFRQLFQINVNLMIYKEKKRIQIKTLLYGLQIKIVNMCVCVRK